eukprot:5952193-Prymnesium_polylepis.2
MSALHRISLKALDGVGTSNQVALLAELTPRDAAGPPILVGVTHLAAAKEEWAERLREAKITEI